MLNENQAYCKDIADEINAYYEGRAYRNEDGETIITDDPINGLEQLDLYDYLDDTLDVEYLVQSDRRTLNSVKVYVTLGGPTVWIDTGTRTVELRWGGESASWGISWEAADEIDLIYQEIWDNG